MEKQEIKHLQMLSEGIGDFIRYWGFRKIHGEIWAVVYLSKKPLSGIEIAKILKVSKALVSPGLQELEAEGLIRQTTSENSKTKRYTAQEEIEKIIQGVLKRREAVMISKIQKDFSELNRCLTQGGEKNQSNEASIDPIRLQKMGRMIQMAGMGLETLLLTDAIWEN